MTDLKTFYPAIVEETASGYDRIDLQSQSMSVRKIFLLGEVDDDMANTFALEMMYLMQKKEPITIYINSPGGSVNAGLVIYDIMQSCNEKMEINTFCCGQAASMAAILLTAGTKGHRYILPHSKVMIHEPLISNGLGGSATSIKKTSDAMLEVKKITNGILAKHTGKTSRQIDKATSYDNFMTAQEAVNFGICDEIRDFV